VCPPTGKSRFANRGYKQRLRPAVIVQTRTSQLYILRDCPMLRHVVLLRFQESTTADVIAGITEALHSLAPQISTVRSFSVDADLGLAEGNAHMVIMAEFDDLAGYEFYRDHPEHQLVIKEKISAELSDRAAAQYIF